MYSCAAHPRLLTRALPRLSILVVSMLELLDKHRAVVLQLLLPLLLLHACCTGAHGMSGCAVPDHEKIDCLAWRNLITPPGARGRCEASKKIRGCCFEPTDNVRTPACYMPGPSPEARHCHSLDTACSRDSSSCSACDASETVVPNHLHYVRVGPSCPGWINVLSVMTAKAHQQPDAVYAWTDSQKDCDSEGSGSEVTVGRCMQAFGATKRSLPPWQTYTKEAIFEQVHRSDLARLHVLNAHGGIYVDQDVLFTNNVNQWRQCPFTMGTDGTNPAMPKLNNGLMLSAKGSRFGEIWWRNLRDNFNTSSLGWDTHSCVWPFLLCRAHPTLVASTSRLGTIAAPRVRRGDGERLFMADYATIEAFLQDERDAFHLTAFRDSWLERTPWWDHAKIPGMPQPRHEHEKPARDRLRWLMEIAVRKALGALTAPLNKFQRACLEQAAAQVLRSSYNMTLFDGDAHWIHGARQSTGQQRGERRAASRAASHVARAR